MESGDSDLCIIKKFPTNKVQPVPFKYTPNAIIYCTRYEEDNKENTGIFQFNTDDASNELIKSWDSMDYYPRFHATIYSRIRNTFFSVGGIDVKNENKDTNIIFSYNFESKKSDKILMNTAEVGRNCKLMLTDDDNYLHIIAGNASIASNKHIRLDLTTNEFKEIHDWDSKSEGLYRSEHGLLFSKTRRQIYMFGGIDIENISSYNDFWICDIEIDRKTMRQIICSWARSIFGNVAAIPNEIVNLVIAFDGYNWNKCEEFNLPAPRRAFGYILYDDRVIIMFGGEEIWEKDDRVYYLDLEDDKGWVESRFKLPRAGISHVLMMDEETLYVVPFYSVHSNYYIVKIDLILPQELIREDSYGVCRDIVLNCVESV